MCLAETLHFGRAAATLGLAQSSLSEVIRRLERKLDVVLLDRTSRRVTLSGTGERMLPVAQAVLSGLADLRDVAHEAGARTDVVRIGIESCGFAQLNGPIIAAIGERLDGATLVVRESLGTDAAFSTMSLDIALVRSPADASITVHPVATEARGLLVPPSHRLARRARGTLAEVVDEPFVATAPRVPRTSRYWLAVDQRQGGEPTIGGVAHTMQETVDAVGHLGLLTTGCASMVRCHPYPRVAFVAADDLPPSEIGVALRRAESRPAILGLVDVVRQVVGQLAPALGAIPFVP